MLTNGNCSCNHLNPHFCSHWNTEGCFLSFQYFIGWYFFFKNCSDLSSTKNFLMVLLVSEVRKSKLKESSIKESSLSTLWERLILLHVRKVRNKIEKGFFPCLSFQSSYFILLLFLYNRQKEGVKACISKIRIKSTYIKCIPKDLCFSERLLSWRKEY